MSRNPYTVHPDLRWSAASFTEEVSREIHEEGLRAGRRVLQPFHFDKLPISIQQRIFETIYVKPGVVHCLSRMDKWNEPISEEHFPLPSSGNSGFPHRFVFGEEMCSMIRARKPNTVLRTFLVSRRWLYLGIHAFYGLNTFAFSSLGEFGRFFNGIGEARAERVAHIELLWHGSIMPRHETRTNQRTLPLIWLTRMKRLITVTIFIEEFAERRIRRKYEFPKIKGKYDLSGRFKDWTDDDIYTTNAPQSLLKRTATQPNWRGNRSMRTTHGMDFLYQLRGMKWVRFYEVDNRRRCIRDWSFFDDINSVVTMPKDRIYTLESDLRNLTKSTGLLYYQPSDEDQDLVSRFYAPDALPSIFSGSETSISDRSSPNNSQSRSTNSDMTSMDTDDDSNDGDNDKDRPPYIHFPDEWSDFSDDLEQSPGPDMDDDVPCDSIEDEDEGNDANDSGVDLMQDDDNDTATEGGIGGDLPDDSDRSYKTQATGQDKATQQGASHNNDDNDDGAVSEVLVPSYGAERGLPIMSDKLGFPTPSTQLIFTNSEASVSTTASTAPTCSHDNGDDEDDNATVSTGLFVRGTTPAPTVFSQRSPSANPSNRSYISPPPVPSQSPSAPHGNFVDLTVDSDQEMENNRTVSDDQDTESLFASSITAVSTINGPESTSSEENCRRALIIDLTQDSDNDSKVEAKFQPAGEDDEPVHVDVIEDIKTDLDGDTESLKRKFEHDDEDHEGDRNQKRARTFPLEADDGSTTSII